MPPPPGAREDILPPPNLTSEAAVGFGNGAIRFGAISLLAHFILSMPHPLYPGQTGSSNSTTGKTTTTTPTTTAAAAVDSFAKRGPPAQPSQPSQPSQPRIQPQPRPRPRPAHPLLYRPFISLSASLAPASRVYRGLTPQFKVFLQMSAMCLGGCIWAEEKVALIREHRRRERRFRELYGKRERE